MAASIPQNFCPVPWLEAYVDTIGDVRACCLERGDDPVRLYHLLPEEKKGFFNSDHYKSLRRSFLNGEKNPRCKHCWTTEAQGLHSHRHRMLERYSSYVPAIVEAGSVEAQAPIRMDVRLSNRCNVQCKMCSPSNSNQISGLVKRMREAGIRSTFTERAFREDNQSEFLRDYILENETIVSFLFAGGEPFVMPEFNEFLDFFIADGRAAQTDLHILNNLTAVKDSVLQKLAAFRSVDLSCSFDGIGEEFEFQRYPSQWEKCRANFERILHHAEKHPNIKVSLTPCITHLNVRSMPDYLRYVHGIAKFPIYNGLNLVVDPVYLDYRFVPLKYRREIAADLTRALNEVRHKMWPSCFENWTRFAMALASEETAMSSRAKTELRDAVQAWEFEAEPRFEKLYPWGAELLNMARHPEIDLALSQT